VRDEELEISLI